MLNTLSPRERGEATCINARPIDWLCVVQSVCHLQSPPDPEARTEHLDNPIPRRCTLTLIVNTRWKSRLTGCVCLHALSSFQRTDRSCAGGARPTMFGVSGDFFPRGHRVRGVREHSVAVPRRHCPRQSTTAHRPC